jgi:hypothetical protein
MLEIMDGGTLNAVAAGIGEDLAHAAQSGNAGQFQVDLQAVYDYYFKVYDIWQRLNHHANALPRDPFAMACLNTGQIPGVSAAIESTVNGALGAERSMRHALEVVRGNLSTHLQALHDVYVAYVNVDAANASKLTQAGTPRAAGVNIKLPKAAGKEPAAWVSGLVGGSTA